MTPLITSLLIFLSSLFSSITHEKNEDEQDRLLVFTKANISVHESIQAGTEVIKQIADEHDLQVTVTEDSTLFNRENLSRYRAVIFANTSGAVLDDEGKEAFKEFIQNGGGFAGIHAATTTEYDWEWYGRLVGTYFDGHPRIQTASLTIHDHSQPSTSHLPDVWEWEDEWYNWQHPLSEDINVLLTVDETSYEGGNQGDFHPVSWYHEFEGGRSWYTALGHGSGSYTDPDFIQHLTGGILWTAGLE
ncbi:MAG: ThuA domain-containing protein [Balneolales bacterium]